MFYFWPGIRYEEINFRGIGPPLRHLPGQRSLYRRLSGVDRHLVPLDVHFPGQLKILKSVSGNQRYVGPPPRHMPGQRPLFTQTSGLQRYVGPPPRHMPGQRSLFTQPLDFSARWDRPLGTCLGSGPMVSDTVRFPCTNGSACILLGPLGRTAP